MNQHTELTIYGNGTTTDSGLYPWQSPERDNWYVYRGISKDAIAPGYVRKTAHAAAIGRALLARNQQQHGGEWSEVRVYLSDREADAWPGDEEEGLPLAVITDPRPVSDAIAAMEQNLEAARIAQRAYETARARLAGSMIDVYNQSDDLDRSDPNFRSANGIAGMVKGVISRPTVLKALSVHEEEADN